MQKSKIYRKTSVFLHKIYTFSVVTILTFLPMLPARASGVTIFGSQTSAQETLVFAGFVAPSRHTPDRILKKYTADLTAYTSSVEECDEDPFVTADGSSTYDGIVAVNWLPFNTQVRIPEIFGDKVFTVHDRMNTKWDNRSKYRPRMDIWMEKKEDMREFGVKRVVTVEVVKWGDGKTQWAARAAKIALNQ